MLRDNGIVIDGARTFPSDVRRALPKSEIWAWVRHGALFTIRQSLRPNPCPVWGDAFEFGLVIFFRRRDLFLRLSSFVNLAFQTGAMAEW